MINNYEFFNDCVYIMSALKKFGAQDIVVAGGCIRDTLLGKPVKDIDVFFTGTIELDDKSDLAKHYGIKWNTSKEFVNNIKYEDSDLEVADTNLLFEGIDYPVQLIAVKTNKGNMVDIKATIDKFPCGLSKVALDSNGNLSMWSDFLQNDFFKIVSYSPETPIKYKTKLQQKYPEFSHE